VSLAVLILVLVVGARVAVVAGTGDRSAGEASSDAAGDAGGPDRAFSGGGVPADRATPPAGRVSPTLHATDAGEPGPLDRARDLVEGSAPDWWGVLAALDELRSEALERGDRTGLDEYAEPGSPAWRADAALLDGLRSRGLTPVGLTTTVVAIESAPEPGDGVGAPASPGASAGPAVGPGSAAGEPIPDQGEGDDLRTPDAADGAVWLVVVDERSAYSLRDAAGSIREVPPAGLRRWRIGLVPNPGDGAGPGWLVRSVEPMP
jgi:hypothetical protein